MFKFTGITKTAGTGWDLRAYSASPEEFSEKYVAPKAIKDKWYAGKRKAQGKYPSRNKRLFFGLIKSKKLLSDEEFHKTKRYKKYKSKGEEYESKNPNPTPNDAHWD